MYYGTNSINAEALQESMYMGKCKKAEYLNGLVYKLEHDMLCNNYMSRFRWNFGELQISDRYYIERQLLFHGSVIIFKDESYGALVLPFQELAWNIYGYPTKVRAYSTVTGIFYNKEIDTDDAYILWDNPLHFNPIRIIRRYALEIADVSRSVDVYARAMKKPLVISSTFDTKESVKKSLEKQFNNDFYIHIDRKLDSLQNGEIQFLQNNSHNAQDLRGLYMHKKSLFDECLAKCGIEVSNIYKAAQTNTDEVNKNDCIVKLTLQQSYDCRVEAAKKLAEIAQTNVTCENLVDITDEPTPLKEEVESDRKL